MQINEQIKKMRLEKGYTLEQLAELTGFTRGYISKIERADQPPPFSTLTAISKALGVDTGDFFKKEVKKDIEGRSKNIEIIASKSLCGGKTKSFNYEPLLVNFKNKQMTPFLLVVNKGKTEYFRHDSEEFLYVIKGRVELHYENRIYTLKSGYGIYLDSRIKHMFENKGRTPASIMAVNFDYKRF